MTEIASFAAKILKIFRIKGLTLTPNKIVQFVFPCIIGLPQ